MKTETEVCVLCFKIVPKCENVNKTLEMLKFLHIEKLNFTQVEDSTVCSICMEKIKDAFAFKTICLKSEEGQMSSETFQRLNCENLELCRFCKHSTNRNSAVLLLEMLKKNNIVELFLKYLPEIDLEATVNPIICEFCQASLVSFSNFILILSGSDAVQEAENTLIDQMVKTETEYMNSSSTRIDLNETDTVGVKKEICENSVYSGHEIIEVNIKEERLKEEIDSSDAVFCNDNIILSKFKEYVENENDAVRVKIEDDYQVRNEGDEYAKFLIKNEGMDFKPEPDQCLINGIGSKEIVGLNTQEQVTVIDHCNKIICKTTPRTTIEELGTYKCQQCDHRTKYKNNLKNHMLTHVNTHEVKMHKCQQCPFQTKYKSNLRNHILIHKNVEEVEMHKCTQCIYQTKIKSSLVLHMRIHKNSDEVEMYKCQQCNYETKFKGALRSHIIIHKNSDEVEIYMCQQCPFQTRFKSNLKSHLLVHKKCDEVEIYKCQQCTYQTKYKSHVKTHMLIHRNTDEIKIYKMHKCQHCPFQTKYKSNLTSHVLIHKNDEEVEMHKCHHCIYQTKIKENLKKHVKIHKSSCEVEMHKCQHCNFQTKLKGSLRQHMLMHKNSNEVEIHMCQQCSFQTRFKCNLKKHLLIHKNSDEVEMYKCGQCAFQTKFNSSLKRHISTHKTFDEVEMSTLYLSNTTYE